ncbi:MAG: calcium-binding protein [Arenibacterium sp.]
MVNINATGRQSFELIDTGLGFPSFFFSLGGRVEDASATGFTFKAGSFSIPGFPSLDDPAPDVYSGVGLTFETVTHQGTSILTPKTGTITGVTEDAPDYNTVVTDVEIDAADWFAVTSSFDDADNFDLLKKTFSGNDIIRTTSVGDNVSGYAGNDIINGRGGNDLLLGAGGRDKIKGGGGADKIDGGKGRDVLTGGAGADTFTFKTNKAGRDKIKDFGRGADKIEIKAAAVDRFSDLTIDYTGDDALISYAGTRIKVLDVGQNGLDAGDFIF